MAEENNSPPRTGGPIDPETQGINVQQQSRKEEAEEKTETTHQEVHSQQAQDGSPGAQEGHAKPDSHAVYYATSMLAAGFSEASIMQELQTSNYSQGAIDKALEQARQKLQQTGSATEGPPTAAATSSHKPKRGLGGNEKLFVVIYTVLMFFLIGWTSLETGASVGIVFVSFLPTLLTIAASLVFFSAGKQKYMIAVWIVPVFMCIGWYALATSGQYEALAQTSQANIVAFNFLLSMVYILILDLFEQLDQFLVRPFEKKLIDSEKKLMSEVKSKTSTSTHSRKSQLEENISVQQGERNVGSYIQAIEDKSKALNFAIGRVYSNKHGGDEEMRAQVRIPKEAYNLFASVPPHQIHENLEQLSDAVQTIGGYLNAMTRTEKEMFGQKTEQLKLPERDEHGNDRVIDVLIKNDKDPVKTYYESAVEFCNKAASELQALQKQEQSPTLLKQGSH